MDGGRQSSVDRQDGNDPGCFGERPSVPVLQSSSLRTSSSLVRRQRPLSTEEREMIMAYVKKMVSTRDENLKNLFRAIETRWAILRTCTVTDMERILDLQRELAELTSQLRFTMLETEHDFERVFAVDQAQTPLQLTTGDQENIVERCSREDSSTADENLEANEGTGATMSEPLLPQRAASGERSLSRYIRPVVLFVETTGRDTKKLRKIVAGLLLTILLLTSKVVMDVTQSTTCHGSSIASRYENVEQCASRLSNIDLKDMDSAHQKAIGYFMVGGGKEIPAVCDKEDSLLTVLYSLIMVRERLSILDSSWHDTKLVTSLSHVCSWARVKCNEEGDPHVTSLILTNANLTGKVPPEVSLLKNLKQLQLHTNKDVLGTLPSEIGLLTALEDLMIQETSIGGTVPSTLGRLSALQSFMLYDTLLTGSVPKEVCDLTQAGALKRLHASCDGPTPIISCSCCTRC